MGLDDRVVINWQKHTLTKSNNTCELIANFKDVLVKQNIASYSAILQFT